MLVGLVDPKASQGEILKQFEEAASLVTAFGGEVVAASYQNETRGDEETYIGKGKSQELAADIKEHAVDICIINAVTKPRQLVALYELYRTINPKIRVWDRVDLILGIFEKHAHTAEAKLQIRLASMRHMGPRIYGMGKVLSQQGGGIGTRGIGETNVELMKRHWAKEVSNVRKELDKILKTKTQQMQMRKKNNMSTISIVGYTNAGKSTLFNLLCSKSNVVNDALFVTLDSTVGKLFLPTLKKEVFVTDTIGFIQNLPMQLVDAFTSTLLETIHADVILHVIDAGDEFIEDKISVVMDILTRLKAREKPIIFVLNKSDTIDDNTKKDLLTLCHAYHTVCISAKKQLHIHDLLSTIENCLS